MSNAHRERAAFHPAGWGRELFTLVTSVFVGLLVLTDSSRTGCLHATLPLTSTLWLLFLARLLPLIFETGPHQEKVLHEPR